MRELARDFFKEILRGEKGRGESRQTDTGGQNRGVWVGRGTCPLRSLTLGTGGRAAAAGRQGGGAAHGREMPRERLGRETPAFPVLHRPPPLLSRPLFDLPQLYQINHYICDEFTCVWRPMG
jgi:hypothetical protein